MRSVRFMVPAALVLALTGCGGGDKLAENAIERQIESQSGGDVDVDLSDGGIKIQTEDGEFSMQTDDEGNVSIQSEDGDVSIQSEDGQTVIQSDDGSTVIGSTGGDLPDDFPAALPVPSGLTVEYTQSMSTPDGQTFLVTGTVEGPFQDVLDGYVDDLEAAGFTQQQLTTTPDGSFFAYDDGTWTVSGSVTPGDDGAAALGMTVTPSPAG